MWKCVARERMTLTWIFRGLKANNWVLSWCTQVRERHLRVSVMCHVKKRTLRFAVRQHGSLVIGRSGSVGEETSRHNKQLQTTTIGCPTSGHHHQRHWSRRVKVPLASHGASHTRHPLQKILMGRQCSYASQVCSTHAGELPFVAESLGEII